MRLTAVRSWFVLAALVIVAAAAARRPAEKPGTPPPPPERQAATVENNLKTFDVLDFEIFSNQKWDRLHESHRNDIVVTWPDGHETKGIERHIEDLKGKRFAIGMATIGHWSGPTMDHEWLFWDNADF